MPTKYERNEKTSYFIFVAAISKTTEAKCDWNSVDFTMNLTNIKLKYQTDGKDDRWFITQFSNMNKELHQKSDVINRY